MKSNVLLAWLVCASGALPAAADEFRQHIPADSKGAWDELKMDSRFHENSAAVGGLGFEVTAGGWPRLLQRGFLDAFNSHNDNRAVYDLAGWTDLGQVRLAPGRIARPKLTESSWVHRRYVAGGGNMQLRFIVSRITPAVLFETSSPTLELFAGTKATCWKQQAGGIRAWREMRDKLRHKDVPKHVAFVKGGKVVVADTSSPIPLADMEECWMLFWYGRDAKFFRSQVPNIIHGRLSERMQKDYFMPADMPVLVVFQKRPRQLSPRDDALRVTFGNDGAGAVAVLPAMGFHHPLVTVTSKWKDGLPADIVERCRAWSRRMKHFPLTCEESYAVASDAAVTVRLKYTHLSLPDDWETKGEKLAPVPPVIALCGQYSFKLLKGLPPDPHAISTHSGPYTGKADADTVEYTVTGLDRYIEQAVASPGAEAADARVLGEELRSEVAKMIRAGHLAPAITLDRKHVVRIRPHFANPGETVLALAEAMPYLDEAGKRAAREYLHGWMKKYNPLTTGSVKNFGNPRREYFEVVSPEDYARVVNSSAASRLEVTYIKGEQMADNVYGLWALADATGDRKALEDAFDTIKTAATRYEDSADWATCGYFHSNGDHHNGPVPILGEARGGVPATNGRFGRWVALARIARACGDEKTEQLARFLLARTALLRFAHGAIIRYMYDAKFQTVEPADDWMVTIGGAKGGLLWLEKWGGGEDDVRQAIRWDEFGPAISQMLGTHWMPVLPGFLHLTPEAGRFLGDHVASHSERVIRAVESNAPHWYIVRRQSYLGGETATDSPRNSFSVFMAKCYVQGTPGEEMMRYQDIPFTKVGDLYHIRRLAGNLRCFGGLKWREIRREGESK